MKYFRGAMDPFVFHSGACFQLPKDFIETAGFSILALRLES
jgi:hypothetical protein